MNRIFITSDLHLCHNKQFLYGPRGFSSIDEHDATIIENWNKIVEPTDFVYILGDHMLNDNEAGIARFKMLNGFKHVIWGNHDTDARKAIISELDDVEVLGYAHMLKYKGYSFYLSHYPSITSNYDYDKLLKARVLNICGHTHTQDPFLHIYDGLIYHAELDAHDNKPVLLDDILTAFKEWDKEQQRRANEEEDA